MVVKLEEPEHPLLAGFCRCPFEHRDEIYLFERFSRANVRVLLGLDAERTDMNKPGVAKDQDFPLGWIRRYGKGRVFYSAFGHQKKRLLAAADLEALPGRHPICPGRPGCPCRAQGRE